MINYTYLTCIYMPRKGNLIDIYKFINVNYSLSETLLSPFIDLLNDHNRPLDRYIKLGFTIYIFCLFKLGVFCLYFFKLGIFW